MPEEAVSAEISIENISAVRGQDYDLSAQGSVFSVYIQPGSTTADIAVKTDGLLNNAALNGPRTFKLIINFISSGNAVKGTASECIITINDDEVLENSVSFEAFTYTVREDTQSIYLKVVHTNGMSNYGDFTVSYAATNGSAVNGTDFTLASGTLTFASGESEKHIVIPISNNSLSDGNRSFTVKLSSPSNGVTIGTVDMAHVEITDDEQSVSKPTVSLQDDNTQHPAILVTGIKQGDKLTLYKLNTQTGAKDNKYSPPQLMGGSSYNLSNISTYGSGTYYVTRTEGLIESSYSDPLIVTVNTPQISYIPTINNTISLEAGTQSGTLKLLMGKLNPNHYYFYGLSSDVSRQGQVVVGTNYGSESGFASNQINSATTDNINPSDGSYINIYEVDGSTYGSTIVGITTLDIP